MLLVVPKAELLPLKGPRRVNGFPVAGFKAIFQLVMLAAVRKPNVPSVSIVPDALPVPMARLKLKEVA
jgi:hypothetical protein